MKYLKLSLVAAALAFSPGAFAHTDAYLDTQTAPHGGQLRMAGLYHYELVVAKTGTGAKEEQVIVYITDHTGKAIATAGATGTATILAGSLKTAATLTPDGDNRLKGVAKYVSTSNMKVVISVTLPSKSPEQARFTPLVEEMAR